MSDYYQQMMNYMYSPKSIYVNEAQMESIQAEYEGKVRRIYPEMTTEEVMFRVNRFMKEYGVVLNTNYLDLIFPKVTLLEIYPETLQRCTRSINDAS